MDAQPPYDSPYPRPPGAPPPHAPLLAYPMPPPYGQAPPPPPYGPPGAFPAYMAAYPPAYVVPFYRSPPGHHTFEGIRFLRYGTIIMAVFNLFSLISFLVLLAAVDQMQAAISSASFSTLAAAERSLAASIVVTVIAGFFGLIGSIVGLVGFGNAHRGKSEFGPEHKRAVSGAVGLAVVACVVYLLLAIVTISVNAGLETVFAAPEIAELDAAFRELFRALILTSLIAMVGAMAAGFAMAALLPELMTAAGRRLSGAFLGLSLLGPLLNLIMAFALPAMMGPATFGVGGAADAETLRRMLGTLTTAALVPAFANVLTIFALVVYVGMLKAAEQGARNMISSGLFDPDAPRQPAPRAGPMPGAPPPTADGGWPPG